MNRITESEKEQLAFEILEKLRDTLLPKLMSGELRYNQHKGRQPYEQQ